MLRDKKNNFKDIIKKIFLSNCFLILFSIAGISQDWVTDFKKMNQKYTDANSFSMSISVKIFEKLTSIEPMMSYSGKMAVSGNNYYSEMIGKITIVNENYSLLVDNSQKLIMYKNTLKNKKTEVKADKIPMSIDTAMYKNATAKYLINTATEKKIQLLFNSGQYSKIEVSINAVNNSLTQIIYFSTSKSANEVSAEKIVVDYTEVKMNNEISPSLFSEKKIFKKNGDKLELVDAYKNYRLIDENKSINKM